MALAQYCIKKRSKTVCCLHPVTSCKVLVVYHVMEGGGEEGVPYMILCVQSTNTKTHIAHSIIPYNKVQRYTGGALNEFFSSLRKAIVETGSATLPACS